MGKVNFVNTKQEINCTEFVRVAIWKMEQDNNPHDIMETLCQATDLVNIEYLGIAENRLVRDNMPQFLNSCAILDSFRMRKEFLTRLNDVAEKRLVTLRDQLVGQWNNAHPDDPWEIDEGGDTVED